MGNGGVLKGVGADVVLVVAAGRSSRGGSGALAAGALALPAAENAAEALDHGNGKEGQADTAGKGHQDALVEGEVVEPAGGIVEELLGLGPGSLQLALDLLLLLLNAKHAVVVVVLVTMGLLVTMVAGLLVAAMVTGLLVVLLLVVITLLLNVGGGLTLKNVDLDGILAVHGAVLAEDEGLLVDISLPSLGGLDADNTLLHDNAINSGAILKLNLAEGDEDAEGELDEVVKGTLLTLGQDLNHLGHDLELGVAKLDGDSVDSEGVLGNIKANSHTNVALGNNRAGGGVNHILNVVNGDQEVLGGGVNGLTNGHNGVVSVLLLGKGWKWWERRRDCWVNKRMTKSTKKKKKKKNSKEKIK